MRRLLLVCCVLLALLAITTSVVASHLRFRVERTGAAVGQLEGALDRLEAQLTLGAQSTDPATNELVGTYKVEGQNAAGKTYTGTVEIVPQGSVFLLHWTLGSGGEEVYGVGIVTHGLLVVAAGPPGPMGVMLSNVVAYTLTPGQPLTGVWSTPAGNGIMPETLTKLPAGHPAPAPQQQKAKPGRSKEQKL